MNVTDILSELASMGSESTKRTHMRHGAREPLFGVKVGDLKKIVKRVKKDHALSLALFETGNSDARYLAGLIADEKKISADELRRWAEQADWYMLSEFTVAWVAAESPHGWQLALEWIDSDREHIAATGWSTLSSWVMIRPDAALDLEMLSRLLDRVAATIHSCANRVRSTMNIFIIACGSAVVPLSEKAVETGKKIGVVHVDVGDTACTVPDAPAYIAKVRAMGRLGVKKKVARC